MGIQRPYIRASHSHNTMRYSIPATAAALLATAATTLVTAVPSTSNGQVVFNNAFDAATKEANTFLQNSKNYVDASTGNFGNVVEKGAKWIKEHINDPRFTHVTHAAFSEYRLRINTKSPKICDSGVKQISGYLDIGDEKHLFFWFFESRGSPKKDPLTLWLNGGPGCSSTTGLLFELGPCLIAKEGEDVVYNPNSWNEVSNMIFLDQPVQVGFSYTEGPNVVTTPDAAKDFYAFLQLFMKTYPEYSANDFNIAAESYGGHYVPNFASYIHDQAKMVNSGAVEMMNAAEKHVPINLKSVMIGNGLTDPYVQFASVPEYACESDKAFLEESQCTTIENKVSTCQKLQTYCYDSPGRFTCVPAALYCWGMYSPLQASGKNLYDVRKTCNRDEDKDGPLCYKELGHIETYLNKPEIKEALGAPKELNFASCNMEVNRQFLMTGDSQRNSAALLPPLLEDGIRVLIYAGNEDAMCNYLGNKEWFLALDNAFHKEVSKAKETPFLVKGEKKGSLITAGHGAGNYTFLEVYDAGHMVPTDQPEAALRMFSRWLANKPL